MRGFVSIRYKLKNLRTMKNAIIFTLVVTILLYSCGKNDETLPNCGCDSNTLLTIPNESIQIPVEEQKRGLLFYKHPEIIDGFYDDDEYNNRFWIFQNFPCSSCKSHLIVCNEEILENKYDYLKQDEVYDSVPILFSGNTKHTCKEFIVLPTNYSYNEFILISIENQ